MKSIRLINKLERLQDLTLSEKRSTAAAFNNSSAVIGCITDYLSNEISKADKKLCNPVELYQKDGTGLAVAFILAERATAIKLLNLLTEETEILDDDPSKDI